MDIRRKFLKLTKRTYPYGFEDQLASHLPQGYFKDKHGNYYYKIGNSTTAFTCHLDTACKTQVVVNHKIDKNIISTDGKSILGADDKAGMTILLYMIEKKVPGLYCFFIGEEVGCIGSGKACDDAVWVHYDRMVSFDRRGTKSVITYQSSKRCCSEEFATELSNQLNRYGMSMEPDDTGVYTDSAEFVDVIPECTNISVGYYKEHTHFEHQDIDHLIKLAIAVTKVDWESLPVKRDHRKVEYKPYSYRNYGYSSYDHEYGVGTTKSYDYNDGWDKSPSGSWKKSRRSGKSYNSWDRYDSKRYTSTKTQYDLDTADEHKGRVYYDNLDSDFTESYNARNYTENKFHYDPLKQELYKDYFEKDEIQTLKNQYTDSDNDFDREFFNLFENDSPYS
jgi:hypothetical protein